MSELFKNITETQLLKLTYSYIRHQIDPQPTIPLDYLESLTIEDLDAITPNMFEIQEYTREEVEYILEGLSLLIHKKEKEENEKKH